MLEWLLCFWSVNVQTPTPVNVRRGRGRLEPVEELRQLPFEQMEFSNLLLDQA
jgi:hypothetical protein